MHVGKGSRDGLDSRRVTGNSACMDLPRCGYNFTVGRKRGDPAFRINLWLRTRVIDFLRKIQQLRGRLGHDIGVVGLMMLAVSLSYRLSIGGKEKSAACSLYNTLTCMESLTSLPISLVVPKGPLFGG